MHDAVLMIKCMSKDFQVGFCKVIGNPCRHNEMEMKERCLEVYQRGYFYLPAKVVFNLLLQISLNELRNLLSKKEYQMKTLKNQKHLACLCIVHIFFNPIAMLLCYCFLLDYFNFRERLYNIFSPLGAWTLFSWPN